MYVDRNLASVPLESLSLTKDASGTSWNVTRDEIEGIARVAGKSISAGDLRSPYRGGSRHFWADRG